MGSGVGTQGQDGDKDGLRGGVGDEDRVGDGDEDGDRDEDRDADGDSDKLGDPVGSAGLPGSSRRAQGPRASQAAEDSV